MKQEENDRGERGESGDGKKDDQGTAGKNQKVRARETKKEKRRIGMVILLTKLITKVQTTITQYIYI